MADTTDATSLVSLLDQGRSQRVGQGQTDPLGQTKLGQKYAKIRKYREEKGFGSLASAPPRNLAGYSPLCSVLSVSPFMGTALGLRL